MYLEPPTPYDLVSKIVNDNRDVAPWLTRDILHWHLKNLPLSPDASSPSLSPSASDSATSPHLSPSASASESTTSATSPHLTPSLSPTSISSFSKPKFIQVSKETGRPKGSTEKKRKTMEIAVLAAKNQIADLYYVEVKKAGKQKRRVKKGTMADIVKKVMKENNIEGQTISTSAIKKRLTRNKLVCFTST